MKWTKKLVFICFLTVFQLFSQKNFTIEKTDSVAFYLNKLNLYKQSNNFDLALENANKAVFFAEKKNTLNLKTDSYLAISNLFIQYKKFDIAIEKLLRLVSLLYLEEPSSKLGLTYYNLGLCYFKTNNIKRAEDYFARSDEVYKVLNLKIAQEALILEKARLYFETNELRKATELLSTIVTLPENNTYDNLKCEAYFILGKINIKIKNVEQSILNLNEAFALSVKTKNVNIKKYAALDLANLYQQKTNYKLANYFYQQYIFISQNLIQKNKNTFNSNEISEKIKSDKILKDFEKLEKENKEQERTTKFSKLINILSIALITILSLLSISLYKNNLIRNKSNMLLQDINSELLEAKNRLEKASTARAEFLSTVSHELRTPLNAINGISHILLEDNPKKEQIEYLKSLKFSGNYLLTFINEILEINRIESNNIETENISFNIRELLQNIQNSLKEEAHNNNNKLFLVIDYEVPELIVGDPTKLSQIFINLINNAIKFTQNGTINVNVNLLRINSKSCTISFEVQDTGIGIPNDKQLLIFESFEQGSVEINRKYGGTGLGLTIVKKLVEILGGNIKLVSEVGKGSLFEFTLNFSISNEEVIKQIKVPEILNDSVLVNKKILLVEDNKINQMITKKIIENKQMVCHLCETGEDAITMVAQNQYDLILMDVHLPGINGTIATQEIRKFNTQIPIIALTAISLNENREMLMSFGMTDVVTKPFDPINLYLKMTEILS